MDDLGLSGVVSSKRKRTAYPSDAGRRPADLVKRNFTASAPNQLWVADLRSVSTGRGFVWVADLRSVSTWRGFVYVAFIIDVFSRFIVGRCVSNSLHADLALDGLEMAIWRRHGRTSPADPPQRQGRA